MLYSVVKYSDIVESVHEQLGFYYYCCLFLVKYIKGYTKRIAWDFI